jgi:hypothetical protein
VNWQRPSGRRSSCNLRLAVSAVGIVKTSLFEKRARHSKGRPIWSAAATADTATDQIPYVCRIRSAACSPITTQVAIVFPVVMRGMIEASAMRRQSMP